MLASDWLYMILIGESSHHLDDFNWSFDSCFKYLPEPQEINNALRDAEELKKARVWGLSSEKGMAREINKPDYQLTSDSKGGIQITVGEKLLTELAACCLVRKALTEVRCRGSAFRVSFRDNRRTRVLALKPLTGDTTQRDSEKAVDKALVDFFAVFGEIVISPMSVLPTGIGAFLQDVFVQGKKTSFNNASRPVAMNILELITCLCEGREKLWQDLSKKLDIDGLQINVTDTQMINILYGHNSKPENMSDIFNIFPEDMIKASREELLVCPLWFRPAMLSILDTTEDNESNLVDVSWEREWPLNLKGNVFFLHDRGNGIFLTNNNDSARSSSMSDRLGWQRIATYGCKHVRKIVKHLNSLSEDSTTLAARLNLWLKEWTQLNDGEKYNLDWFKAYHYREIVNRAYSSPFAWLLLNCDPSLPDGELIEKLTKFINYIHPDQSRRPVWEEVIRLFDPRPLWNEHGAIIAERDLERLHSGLTGCDYRTGYRIAMHEWTVGTLFSLQFKKDAVGLLSLANQHMSGAKGVDDNINQKRDQLSAVLEQMIHWRQLYHQRCEFSLKRELETRIEIEYREETNLDFVKAKTDSLAQCLENEKRYLKRILMHGLKKNFTPVNSLSTLYGFFSAPPEGSLTSRILDFSIKIDQGCMYLVCGLWGLELSISAKDFPNADAISTFFELHRGKSECETHPLGGDLRRQLVNHPAFEEWLNRKLGIETLGQEAIKVDAAPVQDSTSGAETDGHESLVLGSVMPVKVVPVPPGYGAAPHTSSTVDGQKGVEEVSDTVTFAESPATAPSNNLGSVITAPGPKRLTESSILVPH